LLFQHRTWLADVTKEHRNDVVFRLNNSESETIGRGALPVSAEKAHRDCPSMSLTRWCHWPW